jgi:GNAT superfamily N-acetyltransferase
MSEHSIVIRSGDLADAPHVEDIELEAATMFPPSALSPDLARQATVAELMSRIAAPLLWVAEIASAAPVGFVLCGRIGSCLHIHEMDVRPTFGRRGIGSRLLAQVCNAAANSGLQFVTLTTFSHLRWNAPFYFSRGFSIVRRPVQFPHLEMALRREKERGLENRIAMVKHAA